MKQSDIDFQLIIHYRAEGKPKCFKFPANTFQGALDMCNAFVSSFRKDTEDLDGYYIESITIDEKG